MKLPFQATASEQRIIGEFLTIAKRRGATPPALENIACAEKYIEALEEFLFPETAALIKRRSELLAPLNTAFARAGFDKNLETAEITLHAAIRNESDYRELLRKLNGFDFDAWARHCAAERQHAD